ncbi:hypothetical protein SADUNF_Sadunf12G0016100 [Salix dunnii]|uniref:Uncharacterized protein n=1 Tax=Salix dunnii TaxID=1413687 RepID=A0A835MRW2_9ROSI|nr:hypothetical protein SADUNF_Sadunf12G0016100 [Salix dunnii]
MDAALSGFVPQTQGASTDTEIHHFIMSSSEVPASPANIAEGGKASLQPKRTPVSEREIEAVLDTNILTRSQKYDIKELFEFG